MNSDTIKSIQHFLHTLKNERTEFERAFVFIHTLQKKAAKEAVPLLETITVIQNEKPLVYTYLKTRSRNIPGLNLLFELSMDYRMAMERIGLE